MQVLRTAQSLLGAGACALAMCGLAAERSNAQPVPTPPPTVTVVPVPMDAQPASSTSATTPPPAPTPFPVVQSSDRVDQGAATRAGAQGLAFYGWSVALTVSNAPLAGPIPYTVELRNETGKTSTLQLDGFHFIFAAHDVSPKGQEPEFVQALNEPALESVTLAPGQSLFRTGTLTEKLRFMHSGTYEGSVASRGFSIYLADAIKGPQYLTLQSGTVRFTLQ